MTCIRRCDVCKSKIYEDTDTCADCGNCCCTCVRTGSRSFEDVYNVQIKRIADLEAELKTFRDAARAAHEDYERRLHDVHVEKNTVSGKLKITIEALEHIACETRASAFNYIGGHTPTDAATTAFDALNDIRGLNGAR